jgi:hypothetical protein
MYNLKLMLKNELEGDKSLATKLAQVVGLANPTPIYKFVNEPEREMDNFNGLLSIVKFLFPDREKEIMTDYCMTLDPNGKCARVSLEYAYSHRYFELADHLIVVLGACKNNDSKEWSFVYSMLRKSNSNEINNLDSISIISRQNLKTIEMHIFGRIVQMYNYYRIGVINLIKQIGMGLEGEITLLKDEFLRKSYQTRLGLLMISICLHDDNVRDSRFYANLVIENSIQDNAIALAYHRLGDTYTFESYEIAYDYMKKSKELYERLGDKQEQLREVKRSIVFLQNHWDKQPLYLNYESKEASDIHEVALFYYKNNNIKQAKDLLLEIDVSKLDFYQKAFHYYYRGVMGFSKEDFYESITYFKLAGDKFYRRLSLNQLDAMGENPVVLKALSV